MYWLCYNIVISYCASHQLKLNKPLVAHKPGVEYLGFRAYMECGELNAVLARFTMLSTSLHVRDLTSIWCSGGWIGFMSPPPHVHSVNFLL